MKKKTILIVTIISLLAFQKCTFWDSNGDFKIVNQELIYDSISKKAGKFDVNIYTTLEFKRKIINRKDYNNFNLVINKDTFPLIPEINIIEKKSDNGVIKIKYISQINFQSKVYENDSFSRIILKQSKIINTKGERIDKSSTYRFKSLITFHKIKEEGLRYE
ncbi:hypothetical protein [Flavobacterium sp. TAB 87]|uniref:hypothetical protein n=1 Tax=Flavobacterium sp. TAB 87 TaxID=1729581 RepID=UPI00076D275D|nr:hypothetical protein [Flavobacterium sp. TAB 87]KVV15073.1 hypothetical protein AP058_01631 [Flavobacterium sp. TAB 87]